MASTPPPMKSYCELEEEEEEESVTASRCKSLVRAMLRLRCVGRDSLGRKEGDAEEEEDGEGERA